MTGSTADGDIRDVVVIGAGPAGIAAGIELRRRGISPLLLERDRVASSCFNAYRSLRINTHRWPSSLPRHRMPWTLGSHPSAQRYAGYLTAVARPLDVQTGFEVKRVDRMPDGTLLVRGCGGDLRARHVVVATGIARAAKWPDWRGRDEFPGRLTHARTYYDGAIGVGRDVLVVGGGNTAADIAVDLASSGAWSVALSIRRPPHMVPRSLGPLPIQTFGDLVARLPMGLGDRAMAVARRAWLGDLAPHGLPAPTTSLAADFAATGTIPIVDRGLARAVRNGTVNVVDGVADVGAAGVQLRDGSVLHPDLVIVATGYTTDLARLVGHLGVVDSEGIPLGAEHPRNLDGLWFLGFNDSLSGQLRQISIDATALARQLSADMRTAG
ncbi:NAD(P)-binding domain-containing protein [Gordonia hydrophobica]|uniref:NAD(P)-binding domain-containing protein n=1 Tax=Gordonia hydrophobica TaxID=40516 RepID=A0ABZ2U5H9_9ACTN|nr:NAD(P)-binding domain-containing protein [Gordonia hydrophobica]MBM7368701.1 cation diffusion facilitator CzcD-associated flavoprotein CzcO [Gordonia hydrophobica]